MTKGHAPVHRLDLRLRELGQLFNSMDPAPFLERDLDRDAEEYIESWAMEHTAGSRFQITLHLQQPPALPDSGQLITSRSTISSPTRRSWHAGNCAGS